MGGRGRYEENLERDVLGETMLPDHSEELKETEGGGGW